MVRDAALSWIRWNLPHPQFEADFKQRLDEAEARGLNLYLAMGSGLTRRGKSYMMHCFCGELFVFEMTPEQTRAYEVLPDQVKWGAGKMADRMQRCDRPKVTLTEMEVDGGEIYRPGQPLVIDVSYEAEAALYGPSVFRLDYDLHRVRSTAAWHCVYRPIGKKGRYRCSFSPIKDATSGAGIVGPIALFLRMCEMPEPQRIENRRLISNICGTLITATGESPAGPRIET